MTSLGFWCCLLLSGLTSALATLSVRSAENHRLAQQFAVGQSELRLLMDQVERSENYCDALSRPNRNDRVLGETARSMSLDPSLTFQIEKSTGERKPAHFAADLSPWIDLPSRSPILRGILLAAAAILLVIAFATLVDGDGPRLRGLKRPVSIFDPLSRRFRKIRSRYHAEPEQ